MSNNQFNLHYEAELNEGIRVTTLSPIFCSGDIEAHSFVVKVMRNGKPVNLAGTTVRGFFIRPDNVTITLEGKVNADGEAVVTLSNACYNKQGRFQLVIRVTMGGVISTVFCGLGGMLLTVTDGFIDEDNVIPSLGDLLAQIDAMKEATAAALEAAARANEAAENAGSGAGYPVVGTVEANKHITLSGDLDAGTYTLHYEDKNGTPLSQIVTLEVTASEGGSGESGGEEPDNGDDPGNENPSTYTNQVPISTDASGNVYNSVGYKVGARSNSSGDIVDLPGGSNPPFATGFIPCKQGDIIRLKNCYIHATPIDGDSYKALYGDVGPWGLRFGLYKSDKSMLAVESWGNLAASDNKTDKVSNYTRVPEGQKITDGMIYQFTIACAGTAYIRLVLAADIANGCTPADAIVTVNQEIV